MQSFDLYPQAWAIYITLGLLFLFLLDLKLRKTGFKRRVAVLSLVAVCAFTPQTVTGADSLAPLILTSLFDAEIVGISAIYKGLVTLLIAWGIIFALSLAIRYSLMARKNQQRKPDVDPVINE